MILEFENPWQLQTPQGTLEFNKQITVAPGLKGAFILNPARCQGGTARRITRTNIAQASGEITHRKFKQGYVVELNAELYEEYPGENPACDVLLRAMGDLLSLHLEAVENNNGRLVWTPSANPAVNDRMLVGARALGPSGIEGGSFVAVAVEREGSGTIVAVTFAFLSDRPYAIDAPQTTTALADGVPATLTNTGTSGYHPVFKVNGPTSAFTITNNSLLDEQGNPLQIVYDSTLPGALAIAGGHYAEIDTFRDTVYLDGNSSNLKPGIDVLETDFTAVDGSGFLAVGANILEIVGATCDVLWQAAFA